MGLKQNNILDNIDIDLLKQYYDLFMSVYEQYSNDYNQKTIIANIINNLKNWNEIVKHDNKRIKDIFRYSDFEKTFIKVIWKEIKHWYDVNQIFKKIKQVIEESLDNLLPDNDQIHPKILALREETKEKASNQI